MVMAYAVLKGSQWVATKVVIPLQDRHFEFLLHLEGHLQRLADSQSQIVADMRKLSETVESLESRMASWEAKR